MKSFLTPDVRINLILLSLLSYGVIILGGLFYLQVIKYDHFSVLAESQHWSSRSVVAKRGQIITADGYPLASNRLSYLFYVEPPKIQDAKKTAEEIFRVLGEEQAREILYGTDVPRDIEKEKVRDLILQRIEEKLKLELNWVALYKGLTDGQRQELKRTGLSGFGFLQQTERVYLEKSLAAHVLGFIGSDYRGGDQGYYGVEGYYDGDLRGDDGKIAEERTARGDPILIGSYQRVDPVDGRDIKLTINRSVQYFAQRLLEEGLEKYKASSGSVVILEPKTGSLLALANSPTFNPNEPFIDEQKIFDFEKLSEEDAKKRKPSEIINKRNLAVSDTYEPGSIVKPLTVSAALDLELITPKTTFQDNGVLVASGHTIDNWDQKHHGTITTIDILALSNNVGSAQVGQKLGVLNLTDYFGKFGLGKLTGIDLEGEGTGLFNNPPAWKEIDLMTAAFGQGIAATPLQMASAFTVFANEGVLMRPHVVASVQEKDSERTFAPEEVTRVIKKETALTMTDILVKAVDQGESQFYNLKNYTIAGKTGTAQIAEGGKYLATKTNATFVGFMPKNPKFVMLVRLEKPTTSVYAAETAVPLWMDIARELVVYFGIPPDR